MTREEMATRLERVCGVTWQDEADIAIAAAELRKTCAGCKHWSGVKWPDHGGHHRCMHAEVTYMPYDGSGFCHRYEVK